MLTEMRRLNKNLSLIIYTCYLKTCFTSKNYNEAISIYYEMKEKGIAFDKVTYNTLVRGFLVGKMSKMLKETVCESIERKIIINSDPNIYQKIHKYFLYDNKLSTFADEFLTMVYQIGLKRNIKSGQFFFINTPNTNDNQFEEIKSSNYLISGYKHKNTNKRDKYENTVNYTNYDKTEKITEIKNKKENLDENQSNNAIFKDNNTENMNSSNFKSKPSNERIFTGNNKSVSYMKENSEISNAGSSIKKDGKVNGIFNDKTNSLNNTLTVNYSNTPN